MVAAAVVAPITANAAVIYSGPLNITTNLGSNSTVAVGGVDVFRIYAYFGGKGGSSGITLFTTGPTTNVVTTASGGNVADPLGNGVTIDASSPFTDTNNYGYPFGDPNPIFFSNAYLVSNGGLFAPGSDAYLGFSFNPTGTQTLFGYAEVTIGANPLSITVVNTAYENSGAAIVTPRVVVPAAVPEPATAALFGIALLGMGGLRRRRRSDREAAPA